MPRSAVDNPLVLPILGLLVEQPRHRYAIFSELRERYAYLRPRNASVYTLLTSLTEIGWLTPTPDADHPSRPRLTVSPAGIKALAERVREQISERDLTGGPSFVTAFSYLGILPRDEALLALRERTTRLSTERAGILDLIENTSASEVHMIEMHYICSRLQHDLEWLSALASRIDSETLDWPR